MEGSLWVLYSGSTNRGGQKRARTTIPSYLGSKQTCVAVFPMASWVSGERLEPRLQPRLSASWRTHIITAEVSRQPDLQPSVHGRWILDIEDCTSPTKCPMRFSSEALLRDTVVSPVSGSFESKVRLVTSDEASANLACELLLHDPRTTKIGRTRTILATSIPWRGSSARCSAYAMLTPPA